MAGDKSAVRKVLDTAKAAGRTALTAPEGKAVCDAYGIPVPQEGVATSAADAAKLAAGMGFPVVLKIVSPDILHKTEAGAVALNLAGAAAVRDAYRAVTARAAAAKPGARIEGVLVQAMARRGTEIILGVTRDADFGPMLMVGLGGIHVEVLKDVAFAPVPLGRDEALDLIAELKGAAVLDGVRGAPPADRAALAELIAALSRFAADHADAVAEIDLNPVIVHPAGQGLTVVDALIVKEQHK